MRTTRRLLIRSVAVCAVLVSARVLGQQTNRLPRVALVFGSTPVADMIGTDPASPYARAFIHGLRDLGLVEGRNIIIERRSTEGRPDGMLALMQEVVGLDVDVIVTTGRGAGMRLDVLWLSVDSPEELETAFATIVRERADALFAMGTHVNIAHQQRIANFALKQRLPSYGFPEAGMLLSYGGNASEIFRRAAVYVKKILDGTKPAELPWEQPTKYLLVINMKTAKALNLTIPQSMLLRADDGPSTNRVRAALRDRRLL